VKFLLATDGSAGSARAIDVLADMPLTATDAVVVLSVPVRHHIYVAGDPFGLFAPEVLAAEVGAARSAVRAAADRLASTGVQATVRIFEGPTAPTIIDTARLVGADCIVLGSRGLGGFLGALGSTARAVARHSDIPVLVVRGGRSAPRRIVAAVDGSPDSDAALDLLAKLPLPADRTVTLLHVTPEGTPPSARLGADHRAAIQRAETERASAVLEGAAARLGASRLGPALSERGRVADKLLDLARADGADLIVLGSRGATLGGGFLQGSVADRVLSEAPAAVLVARAPRASATA
jgi:nucleotide-binding universal stress UspA family protein